MTGTYLVGEQRNRNIRFLGDACLLFVAGRGLSVAEMYIYVMARQQTNLFVTENVGKVCVQVYVCSYQPNNNNNRRNSKRSMCIHIEGVHTHFL